MDNKCGTNLEGPGLKSDNDSRGVLILQECLKILERVDLKCTTIREHLEGKYLKGPTLTWDIKNLVPLFFVLIHSESVCRYWN